MLNLVIVLGHYYKFKIGRQLKKGMDFLSIYTVAFVWFLIICLTVSYAALFLPALYQQSILWVAIIATIALISQLIGCYCYFKAIWTSPGYPQTNLKLHYSETLDGMKRRALQQKEFKKLRKQQNLTNEIKLYIFAQKRRQIRMLVENSYCEKCDNVKLSRVHHCRQCGKCIERMDHHCPWIGNCVGKYNHKYFILFLFYVTIALITVSASILVDYISAQHPVLNRIEQIDDLYYIVIMVTAGMCLLLLFSIGFLLIGQVTLICQNLTTLESFYDGIMNNNPFQKQSIKDHFAQVFGDSCWFLPTKPFPGQGEQTNFAFMK